MYDNVSKYEEINSCIITYDVVRYFSDLDCIDQILTTHFKFVCFDLFTNQHYDFKI